MKPVPSIEFSEVFDLIQKTRQATLSLATAAMLDLYWNVGRHIDLKIKAAEWGDGAVGQLADYLQIRLPEISGFDRRGLYRMRQFYETYAGQGGLLPFIRQITWTHHLIILSKTKTPEEREFYVRMSIRERWSKRELERQINSALFERFALSSSAMPEVLKQAVPGIENFLRDQYLFDFLNLKAGYSEKDLRKALLLYLKDFILEIGRDFVFMGEEYRLQVGMKDFYLDLLFFHRELQCLVGFDLKIEEFSPEHIGKMNFYLEALDRDVKKPHENPSIGIVLCKSKNEEVVEFAMSRNLSPLLIAEYETKLIDKKRLQQKLHDLFENPLRLPEQGEGREE